MEVNNIVTEEDGGQLQCLIEAPSNEETLKPDNEVKKKRRRGKSKRKLLKPYVKAPWQDKRKYDKSKRNNRFRKVVLAKTHAPFNNNQFLMEIHKPEPENNFQILQTPSARTRDSSFSVDSEENYFFSLPDDEEEYLTKEFSSVYEDAQTERLANMSKNELIQEYLLLEAKYDSLVKRNERLKTKDIDDDEDVIADETESVDTTNPKALSIDRESMITDKDTSTTSMQSSEADNASIVEIMQRLKEQDDQIIELQKENEKLRLENENLRQRSQDSSSEDSESDSSSTSLSCSSNSSRSASPALVNGHDHNEENNHEPLENGCNGIVNGFHESP